eukprot:4638949-Alexandrium_andersonii.AAC.1
MAAHYKSSPRTRGSMSAIGKLPMKMLGKAADPRLKAKAAESRHLLGLCPQLCAENKVCLGPKGPHLQAACVELHRVYRVMQDEPRQ